MGEHGLSGDTEGKRLLRRVCLENGWLLGPRSTTIAVAPEERTSLQATPPRRWSGWEWLREKHPFHDTIPWKGRGLWLLGRTARIEFLSSFRARGASFTDGYPPPPELVRECVDYHQALLGRESAGIYRVLGLGEWKGRTYRVWETRDEVNSLTRVLPLLIRYPALILRVCRDLVEIGQALCPNQAVFPYAGLSWFVLEKERVSLTRLPYTYQGQGEGRDYRGEVASAMMAPLIRGERLAEVRQQHNLNTTDTDFQDHLGHVLYALLSRGHSAYRPLPVQVRGRWNALVVRESFTDDRHEHLFVGSLRLREVILTMIGASGRRPYSDASLALAELRAHLEADCRAIDEAVEPSRCLSRQLDPKEKVRLARLGSEALAAQAETEGPGLDDQQRLSLAARGESAFQRLRKENRSWKRASPPDSDTEARIPVRTAPKFWQGWEWLRESTPRLDFVNPSHRGLWLPGQTLRLEFLVSGHPSEPHFQDGTDLAAFRQREVLEYAQAAAAHPCDTIYGIIDVGLRKNRLFRVWERRDEVTSLTRALPSLWAHPPSLLRACRDIVEICRCLPDCQALFPYAGFSWFILEKDRVSLARLPYTAEGREANRFFAGQTLEAFAELMERAEDLNALPWSARSKDRHIERQDLFGHAMYSLLTQGHSPFGYLFVERPHDNSVLPNYGHTTSRRTRRPAIRAREFYAPERHAHLFPGSPELREVVLRMVDRSEAGRYPSFANALVALAKHLERDIRAADP